jgi:putative ABC transport system permease protein
MNERPLPPRWADRFLAWYCNPELLEEIQGDAHELYYERLGREGKRAADFKYMWDVMRFCRLSNVRREGDAKAPGFFGLFWNLNMKIAIRNSARNKTVFFVKLFALAICLAFTFLLTGFVISELSYDHQHEGYDRIYRIGTRATFQGKTTSYAVAPLPMANTLADEVPGIERASRFMFSSGPFIVDGQKFFDIPTCQADTNFLRMFNYEYIHGTPAALDEPNRLVVTESVAKRLFGDTDVAGRVVEYGPFELEVGAVIRDLPLNTHMIFEALVSWSTIDRSDKWDNFNAYTYIKTMPGVSIREIDTVITSTVGDYISEVVEEYDFKYEPIIERVDEIHLSSYLDEDFAPKRSRNYIYIISSVIVLFLLTGLFNYLNLALAELTAQVKKIAILRTFGGIHADHRRVAVTDAILCLLIVAPVVGLIMLGVLWYPGFLPEIDRSVWTRPLFLGLVGGLFVIILLCSSLNSIVISRSELLLSPLKGKGTGTQKGFTLRKFLVATQLSFSIVMIGLISVIVDQFQFVNNGDKGFDDHDVIVISRPGRYREALLFEETIRKMPGVKMVSGTSFYPDAPIEKKAIFELELADGMKNQLVTFIHCDEEYPYLLNLKLKEGRLFDDRHATDRLNAYIINEAAAKEFGWAHPIGKKIYGPENADEHRGEVIGVVEDFHFESMHSRIEPLIIFIGNEDWGIDFVYVKTEPVQSTMLLESIGREYRKLFPDLPFNYDYLDARYRGLYKHDYEIRDIFRSGLIISIIVSALGIFSMSALLLSMRTKEMGIRKVVGAGNAQLFVMHLRPFVVFFLIATVIGLPLVFYLSRRWLNNFAYHIDIDARYFILPGVITLAIIFVATVFHAIKSARVNPVDILKNE